MAISNQPIKTIEAGSNEYYLAAKFLLDTLGGTHTWEDIEQLVEVGFELYVWDPNVDGALEPATAAKYAAHKNQIVLYNESGTVSGTYTEYVILRSGTASSYTYAWEKIGTTSTDLSNYLKKDVTYSGAALSNGAHTHSISGSVTIPTVTVDKTKKIGFSGSGSNTFVKSYSPTTKKLSVTSVVPAVANGTASKATAGTAKNVATTGTAVVYGTADVGTAVRYGTADVGSAVNYGTADVGTAVVYGTANVGSAVTYGTADVDQTITVSRNSVFNSASVDSNGKLSFGTTYAGDLGSGVSSFKSAKAGTSTLTPAVAAPSSQTLTPAKAADSSRTLTPAVAAPNNQTLTPAKAADTTRKITPAVANGTITPYTFTDVNVATVGTAVSVVNGLTTTGSGDDVITALGTPTTGTAISGGSIVEGATGDVVNEHVTVGTTTGSVSGTAASNGAHTHDVKVVSA